MAELGQALFHVVAKKRGQSIPLAVWSHDPADKHPLWPVVSIGGALNCVALPCATTGDCQLISELLATVRARAQETASRRHPAGRPFCDERLQHLLGCLVNVLMRFGCWNLALTLVIQDP